ncbi:hypothetical protein L288_14745 [Sphingobium quisquiliarum P25]|uniref:Short-chain dehydrogenase n=1 Tax=Sphingobium quisquiliarum P25 TaxID=1329909 RepID=T0HW12_9SPHN|nr:SDR family NAD(P)-dependent oxidoreductase [Sphingobium quisquiliarum]EQB03515.1 hypothetical protein L288_14745 [Sphingobium quisquiliarum P25]
MSQYAGQTVYITGGGNGIGRALALAFASRGANLALVDILPDGLTETEAAARSAGAPKVTNHIADVSNREQVDRVASEVLSAHGEVHYLFANAGVGLTGIPLDKVRPEELEWSFSVNVFGVFHSIQSLLPSIKAHGKPAHILSTASVAGLFTPPGTHLSAYSSAKFALPAIMQGFRDSLEGTPVKVSTIYPGLTKTNVEQRSQDLRPVVEGAVAPMPSFVSPLNGEDAGAVSERIIKGMEAGFHHIFPHTEVAREQHDAYSQMIANGLSNSFSRTSSSARNYRSRRGQTARSTGSSAAITSMRRVRWTPTSSRCLVQRLIPSSR